MLDLLFEAVVAACFTLAEVLENAVIELLLELLALDDGVQTDFWLLELLGLVLNALVTL